MPFVLEERNSGFHQFQASFDDIRSLLVLSFLCNDTDSVGQFSVLRILRMLQFVCRSVSIVQLLFLMTK